MAVAFCMSIFVCSFMHVPYVLAVCAPSQIRSCFQRCLKSCIWVILSTVKLNKCVKTQSDEKLGDNCRLFKIFIWGGISSDIYTVENLVLRRRASGAVKRDFRTYIRRYTSPNENFEYGYPHSNALLQFRLKFERCKPRNTARHPTKYDVINDVKLFPAVYRRIYCRKFLTLSN